MTFNLTSLFVTVLTQRTVATIDTKQRCQAHFYFIEISLGASTFSSE